MSGPGGANSPAEVVDRLENEYLTAVTSFGAAAGAIAAAPAVGTAVALPVNIAEVGSFLEASALFVLGIAEVHGISAADVDRRRTLVLAVLLGNGGVGVVEKIAGRTGPHVARQIIRAIPTDSIRTVNKVLGRNFVTKFGTKQGHLVLGRELPFGLGMAIGGTGNAAFGYLTVRAARRAFGPPPPGLAVRHSTDR